jgi:hypothetical protein
MQSQRVFAIATITALLKRLLDNEIIRQFTHASIGNVLITALPPDRISLGTEEQAQLNLHLYRVTPNLTRQSARMLSQQEASPAGHLPLALDLHYLLAAYGEKELQSEVLLGCAAQLFHEHPLLTAEALRSLLTPHNGSGSDSLLDILSSAPVMNQVQSVEINAEFLSLDELSKIWSLLQAHARPALTYRVSMVLLGTDEEQQSGRVEVIR